MKVFISQPMHGRSEAAIMTQRDAIKEELLERGYQDIEIIDSYYKDNVPDDAGRIWYLGNSISLMDKADLVVMAVGWATAKGCRVEYEVAIRYGLTVIFEKDL